MKKRLVIGNWKAYIEAPDVAKNFAKALRAKMRNLSGVEVYLAPPFTLVPTMAEALKRSSIALGAQAVSQYEHGAHTGEVTAQMLKTAGATFVIIGHSERRARGDDEAIVRTQVLEAVAAGLSVVLCIGEKERDMGGEHFSIIKSQITSAIVGLDKKVLSKLVIAYEPVWAIGKHAQDAMKPHELQETVIFIKKTLTGMLERTIAMRIPILYGGSVEAENAGKLLDEGGVNGFLVGHASATVETFLPILKVCK